MEKWKREAIVTGLSVLLVFAFIELVWSFFAGQSWGSSILRDFVYLLLTGIITVITVLSSDNELTKTPPNKSKFSNEDVVNDTVSILALFRLIHHEAQVVVISKVRRRLLRKPKAKRSR